MFQNNNDDDLNPESKPPINIQFFKNCDQKHYVAYEDIINLLNNRLESIEDSFNDTEIMAYKDIKDSLEHCYQVVKGDEYIKEIEDEERMKSYGNGRIYPNNKWIIFSDAGSSKGDLLHPKVDDIVSNYSIGEPGIFTPPEDSINKVEYDWNNQNPITLRFKYDIQSGEILNIEEPNSNDQDKE